jgi:hypothetical protein
MHQAFDSKRTFFKNTSRIRHFRRLKRRFGVD